ncbi:unnamed protein product [Plutella xylostella]|uniref:(diamondback moth) hypothetical protein n=1 Tax=Plutella xylostella TaxID=51655 RepID=A0A8S4GAK5_PLUXY|nr:unnamed protein product [Plutella xylostella]
MSSGKRKLSFLGYAPPSFGGSEDEVRLDEEMEHAVWGAQGDAAAPPLPVNTAPQRDPSAPVPARPSEDSRHVQFGASHPASYRRPSLTREKLRKFSLQETRSPRVPPPAPPLGAAVSNRSVNNNNNNNPHSVFVQLDELLGEEDEAAWTQTARWIKYEQDVEAAGRWGRPHVAPLSFHSLLNLRRCLEQGVVLLDLEEKDLPGIATRVTEKMVSEGLIEADDQQLVISCLLKRHKHVHDGGFRFSISGRKLSSYTSLQVSPCFNLSYNLF